MQNTDSKFKSFVRKKSRFFKIADLAALRRRSQKLILRRTLRNTCKTTKDAYNN